MPQPSLWKDSSETIQPQKQDYTFPKSICLKVNVTLQPEFFEAAVQHVNDYTTYPPV